MPPHRHAVLRCPAATHTPSASADSAYIFVGGLPTALTEGDVITIFSQYGEILDISLPRSKETGARRGFGFLM